MNKKETVNAIRFLSIDAVEKAKSGHPGAPMGMADIAFVLWKKFLKHNPQNPDWPNRDRLYCQMDMGLCFCIHCFILQGINFP